MKDIIEENRRQEYLAEVFSDVKQKQVAVAVTVVTPSDFQMHFEMWEDL